MARIYFFKDSWNHSVATPPHISIFRRFCFTQGDRNFRIFCWVRIVAVLRGDIFHSCIFFLLHGRSHRCTWSLCLKSMEIFAIPSHRTRRYHPYVVIWGSLSPSLPPWARGPPHGDGGGGGGAGNDGDGAGGGRILWIKHHLRHPSPMN